jgi:hypothetical protein
VDIIVFEMFHVPARDVYTLTKVNFRSSLRNSICHWLNFGKAFFIHLYIKYLCLLWVKGVVEVCERVLAMLVICLSIVFYNETLLTKTLLNTQFGNNFRYFISFNHLFYLYYLLSLDYAYLNSKIVTLYDF